MSALGTGTKPCNPDPGGNGCLCGVCEYKWMHHSLRPKECHAHCLDCDPDRTDPDDGLDYGPIKECGLFIRRKDTI